MLGKVAGLLCGVTLMGCGASEEDRIADVVRDYNRASMEGDADKACGLTADEMWTEATCEDIVSPNSLPDHRAAGKRLAEGDYDVTIEGETATAQGHNLGIFRLRKVDGDWKLISAR